MDDDGFTILCKNTFIELFEKTKGFTLSKGPFCIEPIVHLIWLGEKKYPDYARPVLKEWMMLNLQFQFILWVDSDDNLEPFFENLIVKKLEKILNSVFYKKPTMRILRLRENRIFCGWSFCIILVGCILIMIIDVFSV